MNSICFCCLTEVIIRNEFLYFYAFYFTFVNRFYEPVIFQPNIIPVCVPDNDENFIGSNAYVTGWGRLYEGNLL